MISLAEYFCVRKKFLVYNFTSRNLKIKYRRSFFGYLWSLLVPLAQAAVYYLVFKVFLKVQIPNYLPYVVSGVLLWTFFSNTIAYGMEGLNSNRFLLTKIPIPLQVFPLVETLSNAIAVLLALPVLILILLWMGNGVAWPFFFLFYYIAVMACIAYGLGCFLSIAAVIFMDIRHVFSLLVQLWMYATPVVYQEDMIPTAWRWILYINPVGVIFSGMHKAVIDSETPGFLYFFVPMIWALVSLALGWAAMTLARRRGVVELL